MKNALLLLLLAFAPSCSVLGIGPPATLEQDVNDAADFAIAIKPERAELIEQLRGSFLEAIRVADGDYDLELLVAGVVALAVELDDSLDQNQVRSVARIAIRRFLVRRRAALEATSE